MADEVYLNGAFLPRGDAKINVEDRGFLFADGIYEVTYIRHGVPLFFARHLDRLWQSANALELTLPFNREEVRRIHSELIRRHPEAFEDGTVYLQVTRGSAPRTHAFPAEAHPTVFAQIRPFSIAPEVHRDGVSVIVLPDERWLRPEVKSISLLPNILASERARRAAAFEAILVRDSVVTEASHSNFWIVENGTAVTHPRSPLILGGVTRDVVISSGREAGVPIEERAYRSDLLAQAAEAFLTSTTGGIIPVVRIGDRAVGDGRPGPVTRRLMDVYQAAVDADVANALPSARPFTS